MSRRKLYPLALIVLLPGCVPVTEPLSDADKAKPVKELVGKWQATSGGNWIEIDTPLVKGNPPGLMRMVSGGPMISEQPCWFYVTLLGKHTYLNVLIEFEKFEGNNTLFYLQCDREGEFAAWGKRPGRRYFIFHYTLDGDDFALNAGTPDNTKDVMTAEKVRRNATDDAYQTPPGWLAKYLTANGPEKLFPPTEAIAYRRAKK
jgi:hypothetical protein